MKTALATAIAFFALSALGADEVSSFRSYVDTDLCARLMLGPITPSRIDCSQQTAKDKVEPVLVRLHNNMVFTVNKRKMIEPLVGQFAEASGTVKVKNGTMKLQEIAPLDPKSIPAGDPERRLLEGSRGTTDPKVWEK